MRVEVNGKVESVAQGGDEGAGGRDAQEAGHVLDADHVGAGVDDPFGRPR